MTKIRIGLVGLVVASLTGLSAGGASAATATGRGTASSSISLLSVDLGNVQHLKVLTDQGQGTLDAARNGLTAPQAFASLSAVDASGLLNLALPNPALKATAPGSSNVASPIPSIAVNFPTSAVSVAGTATPIGAGILATGTINPVKIEAHNSDTQVDSLVGTSVPDLSVLSGLVGVKGVNIAGLSANSSVSASKGDTGVVTIDSVDVLSLAGLLGGLGIPNIADLPLGTLTGLVDSLGLPVNTGSLGLGNLTGGDISGVLGTATGLLTSLTNLAGVTDCSGLTSAVGNLSGLPILGDLLGNGGILGGLLGTLSSTIPVSGIGSLLSACSAGNITSTVTSVSNTLTSALNGLKPTASGVLDDLLGTLTNAPLISLQGVNFSAVANAADTLAHSSATSSGSFGHILVGGKDLGVLDLNSAVDTINTLKSTVLGTLNSVTNLLGLGNLLDIGILERTASTKADGSYNVATAGLDLLRVSINPPANVAGIVSGLTANNPLTGLLSGLSLPLPTALPLGTGDLAKAFSLTSLLSQPTTIKVGSIGANADYTTAVAGEQLAQSPASGAVGGSGTLPRTGGTNGAWFAALAAISLAGAFGITRSLRKNPAHQGEDH